jgi:flagellar biosynthesis/type III secretory pathway protein FliH
MNRLHVSAWGVLMLALAAPARAQLGWPAGNSPAYVDEARQPYYESRRVAYDNGYREGLKEGEHGARRRERYDYQDERAWQRADKGFHRSYGDRARYQQTFRTGFTAGYDDAYRRSAPNYGNGDYGNGRVGPIYPRYPSTGTAYPRYPNQGYPGNPGRYPNQGRYGYSPAYQNGVNDGYEKGVEDARDRDSYDPQRHRWYRSGDHDYRSEYGAKDQYEAVYRDGFRDGYDRGYRTYRPF